MSDSFNISREPMLEMYVFEANQLMEQLEEILLHSEKYSSMSKENINEIFRIMHTIKGSSAMMMFSNIASLAHSVEDLFYFIRENNPQEINCSAVCDLVLSALDFIRNQVYQIEEGKIADGNEGPLVERINEYLLGLKGKDEKDFLIKENLSQQENKESLPQKFYISKYEVKENVLNKYIAKVFFEEDCQMENIRAFTVVHNLKELCSEIYHNPKDLFESDYSVEYIVNYGFSIYMTTDLGYEDIHKNFGEALFIKSLELQQVESFGEEITKLLMMEEPAQEDFNRYKEKDIEEIVKSEITDGEDTMKSLKQNLISVNINKLDKLMDVVGEIVIAESMVTRNPDLRGMHLENFSKAARQLQKLTDELQDIVMSIRMIPIAATFNKMHRVVRDMSKKLDKEVKIVLIGEETEVDKNIIDHLSDPLMHLVRNAIDHGIEAAGIREHNEKPGFGTITLEAKNAGSDVVVTIKDDGKGLDREKILERAKQNDLLHKSEIEMTDREIFNLILLPGFSTKESITEFSGRGVGMDVVSKNIEMVGGSISVDSIDGCGTTITLKIPLTLAIIDGMNIGVGNARYTLPTIAIKESFRPQISNIIMDPEGNEMIMVRGQCYPILRIHEHFKVETKVKEFTEGILIMIEQDGKALCIFADELLGQQQVVVKALPHYIKNKREIHGLSGCTLLGDGNISLILDVSGLIKLRG